MRLLLILCLLPVFAKAETIRIPGPDGIVLNATLFLPPSRAHAPGVAPGAGGSGAAAPAIVALHGCAGPVPARDEDWARRLAAAGHIVLLPDSYGSRGLGPQCGSATRPVSATGKRRQGTHSPPCATSRPGPARRRAGCCCWAGRMAAPPRWPRRTPPPICRLACFAEVVAFYPGCQAAARPGWEPAAPVLILMGEADDWTPAAPCHALAERLPGRVKLVTYPGALP